MSGKEKQLISLCRDRDRLKELIETARELMLPAQRSNFDRSGINAKKDLATEDEEILDSVGYISSKKMNNKELLKPKRTSSKSLNNKSNNEEDIENEKNCIFDFNTLGTSGKRSNFNMKDRQYQAIIRKLQGDLSVMK